MKKFLLITCLILLTSISYSQKVSRENEAFVMTLQNLFDAQLEDTGYDNESIYYLFIYTIEKDVEIRRLLMFIEAMSFKVVIPLEKQEGGVLTKFIYNNSPIVVGFLDGYNKIVIDVPNIE